MSFFFSNFSRGIFLQWVLSLILWDILAVFASLTYWLIVFTPKDLQHPKLKELMAAANNIVLQTGVKGYIDIAAKGITLNWFISFFVWDTLAALVTIAYWFICFGKGSNKDKKSLSKEIESTGKKEKVKTVFEAGEYMITSKLAKKNLGFQSNWYCMGDYAFLVHQLEPGDRLEIKTNSGKHWAIYLGLQMVSLKKKKKEAPSVLHYPKSDVGGGIKAVWKITSFDEFCNVNLVRVNNQTYANGTLKLIKDDETVLPVLKPIMEDSINFSIWMSKVTDHNYLAEVLLKKIKECVLTPFADSGIQN